VKDKLLEMLARELKMVQVEEGVFMLTRQSRTIYDTKKNIVTCFVS
jgi:hypothetical protein